MTRRLSPCRRSLPPLRMSERIRGALTGVQPNYFMVSRMMRCAVLRFSSRVVPLTLQKPRAWTQGKATLIPKIVAPTSLDKYRGIACLTAVRKLLGYVILAMLPELVFFSVQCGFVPHRQAAEGVYRIKRILEVCREWNRNVHVVQIDLS